MENLLSPEQLPNDSINQDDLDFLSRRLGAVITFTPLVSVTNQTFKVTTTQGVFFYRKHNNTRLLINREFEALALAAAGSSVTVTPLEYNHDHLILPYFPQPKRRLTPFLTRAATLIAALHATPIPPNLPHFDPIGQLEALKRQMINPPPGFNKSGAVIEYIRAHVHDQMVFCHNDLLSSNFIKTPAGLRLIDFEYSRPNHPYFDLMSFISENNITDPSHQIAFLTAYFGAVPSAKVQQELAIWGLFLNLFWAYWALVSAQRQNEAIMRKIARQKIANYRKQLLVTLI